MNTITGPELKHRLDRGEEIIVVDARRPEDYVKCHIPGAILGTSDTIIENATELLPDRVAPVVVYCGSADCKRSLRSAERLESLGYTDVHRYVGGLDDWAANGFPVISDQGAAAVSGPTHVEK